MQHSYPDQPWKSAAPAPAPTPASTHLRPIAAAPQPSPAPQPSTSAALAASASESTASGTAGKRKYAAAPKGKGKQRQEEDDEDGRKLKRNRMALSCRECKRRKVKCDRSMPACGPCTKRGQASGCTWDVFSNEGYLPPTIARTSDLSAITSRLQHIEAFLRTLPPNLASFTPYVPPAAPNTALGDPNWKTLVQGAGGGAQEETFSDTEDAAVDLENGVFGQVAANAAAGSPEATKTTSGTSGRGGGGAGGKLRFGGRDMELTTALTSIVAPERVGSSKVHLDVEFDANPAEVEKARVDVLRRIYRVLPLRNAVNHLVHLYFSRVSWLFHHIHAPSFLAELEAFHAMWDAGRSDEVDFFWVALLLMVLCVALDSTHASRSPLSLDPSTTPNPLASISDEQLRSLPEIFFQASQRALAIGEWESIPRVRSIQTIVLYTQYLQLCSANRGQPSQLVTWLAGGIRLAQVLGLHLLGSNAETMPSDDPAWPPGKNSLKRESAKRLWGVLVFQDWMGASSKNRCYLIDPFHFDTDDPHNLNDHDLSSIEWKTNPAPQSVLTDSSPDRVRIAMSRQVRKVFDAVVLTKDFSYDTVLELDRGYRAILESLPDRWTLEISAEEVEQPMLRYQRHFALEGLHNRIFRLHRPFSTRGYRQAKYRFSTDACVKSARVVIVSTHNIADAVRDVWYTYSHVMGATLVLFNDLFQAIDRDLSAAEIDSQRETLNLAAEIFSRSAQISSPSLKTVVEQGHKIIDGLFRAEETRRVGRAARTLLAAAAGFGGEEAEEEVETFAEVLQRISRSLNSHTERHRGTPPPTRNLKSTSRTTSSFTPFSSVIPIETIASSPWPFPPLPVDGADDLSLQFFQELGMLESHPDGGDDYWGNQAYEAMATTSLEGGNVGLNWGEEERARGDGGSQLSALLDQLGGGW